jgi:hypothetical protein
MPGLINPGSRGGHPRPELISEIYTIHIVVVVVNDPGNKEFFSGQIAKYRTSNSSIYRRRFKPFSISNDRVFLNAV